MTCAPDHNDFAVLPSNRAAAKGTSGTFLTHMWDAVVDWANSGEDAEIAAALTHSGGRLTDDIEREMFQRRTVNNWNVDAH
jgi:hypothetical protein